MNVFRDGVIAFFSAVVDGADFRLDAGNER